MNVIGQAHTLVHKMGVVRIQSSMRVGTRLVLLAPDGGVANSLHRMDKFQSAEDKVKRVEEILARKE
jgi:uncharacterized protein YqgV (UPF0045/DUF77 family)